MLHANPNPSVLTVSPPESGFSPRREFVRDSHVSSSFALLAIAGHGFVRLTSFEKDLVNGLRTAFESQNLLRGIREESTLNLTEFNIEGKPWTQSKTADSERLFVQILAIVFQYGYRFLSTIDYGREQSERVSIAFSRPSTLSAYESTRVPFALSFPSSTVLRVINPPLNSSPAILQAARSAWPRGVVSEKKVSEKCFEFRLKGYRWFQEDTFSSDSLQHILALLGALDRHAFTLLTSVTLSGNHSRVKDLWIFSGSPLEPPADANASNSNIDLSRSLSPLGSKNSLTPVWTSSSQGANHSADTLHGRSGSLPDSSQGSSHTLGHTRAATEPAVTGITRSASVLRKKSSPKAIGSLPTSQSPLRLSSEEFPARRQLSSIGSVDMTGIGSANQRNIVTARVNGSARTPSPHNLPRSSMESELAPHQYETRQDNGRIKTGDLFYETPVVATERHDHTSSPEEMDNDMRPPRYPSPGDDSSSGSHHSSRQLTPRDESEPHDVPQSVSERVTSDASTLTPPILGSGVFRDSAFSSSTNRSYEIPIAWTGTPDCEKGKDIHSMFFHRMSPERDSISPESDEGRTGEVENRPAPGPQNLTRSSTTPKFPGAWQPTPIVEMPEDQGGLASPEKEQNSDSVPKEGVVHESSPERKEVDAERVASPMLSDAPGATRKSEVALYGMVTPPIHTSLEEKRRSSNVPSSPIKPDGWVLVNVADGSTERRASGVSGEPRGSSPASRSSANRRSKSPQQFGSSLSPIAKAIAVEDAKKSAQIEAQSRSGLRRFFSGSKSKSRKPSVITQSSAYEAEGRKRKPSLRDRWRKKAST